MLRPIRRGGISRARTRARREIFSVGNVRAVAHKNLNCQSWFPLFPFIRWLDFVNLVTGDPLPRVRFLRRWG